MIIYAGSGAAEHRDVNITHTETQVKPHPKNSKNNLNFDSTGSGFFALPSW